MYNNKAIEKIKVIKKKIVFIKSIVSTKGSVVHALEDEQNSRAAILIHLTSIAEQFDKLLHNAELEILSHFEKEDIKVSCEIRNTIIYNYENVDLYIVQNVINERLQIIEQSVNKVLEYNDN